MCTLPCWLRLERHVSADIKTQRLNGTHTARGTNSKTFTSVLVNVSQPLTAIAKWTRQAPSPTPTTPLEEIGVEREYDVPPCFGIIRLLSAVVIQRTSIDYLFLGTSYLHLCSSPSDGSGDNWTIARDPVMLTAALVK